MFKGIDLAFIAKRMLPLILLFVLGMPSEELVRLTMSIYHLEYLYRFFRLLPDLQNSLSSHLESERIFLFPVELLRLGGEVLGLQFRPKR